MTAVAECLSELRPGEPLTHANLTLLPLLAEATGEPGYLLLDEALARGLARVREVSEQGHVPELSLVNEAERPVLLLDGEELVGAKQNRILNVTVLAPARSTLVVPVSCVEGGRWHYQAAEFASSDRAHYASGRARKADSVSMSLRESLSHRSDQGEVWADIAEKSARLGSRSDTGAAAAMYEDHRARLDEYAAAFAPVAGQVGAVFAVNGRALGLDLFDHPGAFARLLPKLVRSYALDAIDEAGSDAPAAGEAEPAALLAAVAAARLESFPAVGLGEDVRLAAEGLAGGALVVEGKVVHLCAFRVPGGGRPGNVTSLASASRRRRLYH